MKKLLLLIAMTLYIAPSLLADTSGEQDITIKLLHKDDKSELGTMTGKITYDGSKTYTLPNFLGFVDRDGKPVTMMFTIGEVTADNGNLGLMFIDPRTEFKSDGTNNNWYKDNQARVYGDEGYNDAAYYNADLFYFNWPFDAFSKVSLPLAEGIDESTGAPDSYAKVLQSSPFVGPDESNILLAPDFWSGKTAAIARTRTYATLSGNTYNCQIEGNSAHHMNKMDGADDWSNLSSALPFYLNFSFDKNGFKPGVTTGIEDIDIESENAPVEYFNLQGIKVDNPTNGLYIRRQGNKVTKVAIK